MDFLKIKNVLLQKITLKKKKRKRQVTDWEKLFEKHVSVNELVTRIYKECLKPSIKISNPIKNGKKITIDTSKKK